MKRNHFHIIYMLVGAFLLGSCTATKSVAQSKKQKAPATEEVKIDNQPAQEAYIEAVKAKLLGDFGEALKLFDKSLKLDPSNHAALYEMAQIFFQQNDYDQALKYSQEAYRIDGTNKWYALLYAESLEYKGEYLEAAGVYEKLLKQTPQDLDLYFEWAYMLVKANKLEEAIKVYDMYENKAGIDENVIIQKERLYVRLKKIDKAAAELRKLIDSNPAEAEYYRMLAELYALNDMNDKAAKVFEELLQIDKENPIAMLYLAEMHRMKGEDEIALEYLKKACSNPQLGIDVKVKDILFPYLRQIMSGQPEKKEEAFQLAQLVIEAHPNEARAHAIYGDMLYQDKQSEDALAQYLQALELDSSVFEIWQQLFFIYSELKQYEELEKTTQSALELYPNQPLVYFFNGIAKSSLEKYKEAVEILTLGEPLVIDNDRLKAQINSTLGEAYNYLQEFALSDSAFEKSLLLDPDNSYTLNNYAYYLSVRGANLERSKEMSEKSIRLEPNNSAFEDTYAWILYKMENYSEAKKWVEKSIENGGNESPVILEHYGDILFKLGEVDKAVISWQKAKSLGSDSELIGKKIAERKIYE